jgi:hypothetical protein
MKIHAWRPIVASVAVVVGALLFVTSEVRAGIILPLAHDAVRAEIALPTDNASSSAPAEPASDSNRHQRHDQEPVGISGLNGPGQTGGASAPVSSIAGSAASGAVATLEAPMTPRAACTFRALREQRVQLPQPPLGELLDPPKACA